MFDTLENLNIVSSYVGESKVRATVENRKRNGFIFKTQGATEYTFGDRVLRVGEGEMLFVPCGISYSYSSYPENQTSYVSVNFDADVDNPIPTVYNMENFHSLDFVYNHFSSAWKMGSSADKYKCISVFYEILSFLSGVEHAEYQDKHKKKIIEPALEYLRAHIFAPTLTVDKLSRLCGISDTYFRKIFVANFGVTPQKYIVNQRISHAKAIIDSGDFDTIYALALSVGYTDPLYFSRAFKNKYGTPPTGLK